MPGPLWFLPISNIILAKVTVWLRDYEKGKVYATRDFMTEKGKFVKKPTIYEVPVTFTQKELTHFVKLIESVNPNKPLTKKLIDIRDATFKGMIKPTNGYTIPFRFYRQDVEEIYNALLEARSGVKQIPISESVEQQIKKDQAPFEI